MKRVMSAHIVLCLAPGLIAALQAQSTPPKRVLAWGGLMTFDGRLRAETFGAISAGDAHCVAQRPDGSLLAWGYNLAGQCNVPGPPSGLQYVRFVAGGHHTMALRSDGNIIAWGRNFSGQCNVPPPPAGQTYTHLAAGSRHS